MKYHQVLLAGLRSVLYIVFRANSVLQCTSPFGVNLRRLPAAHKAAAIG